MISARHTSRLLFGLFALSLTACGPAPVVRVGPSPGSEASPSAGPATPSTSPTPPDTPGPSPSPDSGTEPSPQPTPQTSQQPSTQPASPAPTGPSPSAGSATAIARLSLDPDQRYLTGAGQQRQLSVTAYDAQGRAVLPLPALSWVSSRPQDVQIDAQGLITALVDEGFAEISVRVPGQTASASLLISVSSPNTGGSSSSGGGSSNDEDPFAPVTSEGLLVSSDLDGSLITPDVALDADGNSLVVWHESNSSDYDVYGRRYASGGSPRGEEFRINSFTAEDQYDPVVAALGDGSFVVAWTSEAQDGSAQGIVAQRIDRRGRRLGDEFVVNDVTTGNQSRASVASDGDGDYVVAWEDSYGRDGDASGVYARHFAGSRGGTTVLVNSTTTGDQSWPNIDLDDDGDFVVVYEDEDMISARRFDAGMTPRGASFRVDVDSASSRIGQPSVDLDEDGDFTVVWKEEYYLIAAYEGDIYTRRYTRGGAARGDVVRIEHSRTDLNPDVVSLDDGRALVLWWNDAGAEAIHAQYLARDGSLDGEIFDLEAETDHRYFQPRVTRNADGQAVVTWIGDFSATGNGIGLKYFMPD